MGGRRGGREDLERGSGIADADTMMVEVRKLVGEGARNAAWDSQLRRVTVHAGPETLTVSGWWGPRASQPAPSPVCHGL